MQLSELNIGDTFIIDRDEEYSDLYGDIGNYMKISPNTDNFNITHIDEYFDIGNYSFVLNLDTSTLGILLLTQEITLNDWYDS